MSENILDLSTIVDRPTIKITSKRHPKGKLYELLGAADLSPFEYAEILQRSAEADQLRARKQDGKSLTSAQQKRIVMALDDIVRRLIPTLEPTVLGELTTAQKEMIVLAWSAQVAASGEQPGKA